MDIFSRVKERKIFGKEIEMEGLFLEYIYIGEAKIGCFKEWIL